MVEEYLYRKPSRKSWKKSNSLLLKGNRIPFKIKQFPILTEKAGFICFDEFLKNQTLLSIRQVILSICPWHFEHYLTCFFSVSKSQLSQWTKETRWLKVADHRKNSLGFLIRHYHYAIAETQNLLVLLARSSISSLRSFGNHVRITLIVLNSPDRVDHPHLIRDFSLFLKIE